MLGTVIINRYSLGAAASLADSIEELCSPNDSYGWSSSGIYCFWDSQSKEVLYFGLAIDLPLRFRQHNGLAPCDTKCCKYEQILKHFKSHQHLGFSVLVQSPLSQAITHRWVGAHPGELEWIAENFGFFDPEEVKDELNQSIVEDLRAVEGTLLDAYKSSRGRFPIWNKMGGLKMRHSDSQLESARYFMQSLTHSQPCDVFMARCTFEELAQSTAHTSFETFLHGARVLAALKKIPLKEAWEQLPHVGDIPERMQSQNYLNKQPLL